MLDEKYQVQDAQSAMRIRCHPAVLETCQNLRRNFETLCRARSAGCEEVKVVVRDGCRCYSELDGTYIKVAGALASFYGTPASGPLLPLQRAGVVTTKTPSYATPSSFQLSPQIQMMTLNLLRGLSKLYAKPPFRTSRAAQPESTLSLIPLQNLTTTDYFVANWLWTYTALNDFFLR